MPETHARLVLEACLTKRGAGRGAARGANVFIVRHFNDFIVLYKVAAHGSEPRKLAQAQRLTRCAAAQQRRGQHCNSAAVPPLHHGRHPDELWDTQFKGDATGTVRRKRTRRASSSQGGRGSLPCERPSGNGASSTTTYT